MGNYANQCPKKKTRKAKQVAIGIIACVDKDSS
jgi:hypothetical protein